MQHRDRYLLSADDGIDCLVFGGTIGGVVGDQLCKILVARVIGDERVCIAVRIDAEVTGQGWDGGRCRGGRGGGGSWAGQESTK